MLNGAYLNGQYKRHRRSGLLLPMTGSNGSTAFVDRYGKTITALGNAQISTGVADPFGNSNGVALFDGSGDFLSIPDSNDWDFGQGDFTVETWVRFTAHTSIMTLIGNYLNSSTGWTLQYRSDIGGLRFGNGDTALLDGSWSPSDNVWYHIAACRHNGTLRSFAGGGQLGSVSNSTNIAGSSQVLSIGALFFSSWIQNFNGRMCYPRISPFARYTGPFDPPTGPFLE